MPAALALDKQPCFNDSVPLPTAAIKLSDAVGTRHAHALARQSGKPVHLIDGAMMSSDGGRSLGGLRCLRQIAGGARLA